MNRKELSEAIEAARKRQDAALSKQEAAVARQEAAVTKHEATIAKYEAVAAGHEIGAAKAEESFIEARAARERSEKEGEEHRRWMERVMIEGREKTDEIIAELKDQRDERRALLEAIFRVIDRLDRQPPPPPNLRSV